VTGATQAAPSLSDRIVEGISIKTVFTLKVFGLSIPISDTVVTTWAIMALLVVGALFATRRLKERPHGFQVLLETFIDFINTFTRNNMGHRWRTFAPFIGTIALYLAVANVIPFFTPVAGFGFEPPFPIKPPTRDINITSAFAITTICTVFFASLWYRGPIGWLKGLAKPSPVMIPFNLLEYFIRPLSLSLRLFGNILGAYIVMQLIEAVLPIGAPPILGLYFDFFDGLIQAVIFTFLSTIFIAEAVE
jgi:F-type H+-transporting ATPase subunit a